MARPQIVHGDLLDQPVEVIVNAWNRNFIPWWLLLPQGVSGAIKRRGGTTPFKELSQFGVLKAGQAVETGPGRLPFKSIIHVAGLEWFWMPSQTSIKKSVNNALNLAQERNYKSIAFPLIGAGTGGMKKDHVLKLMKDAIETHPYSGEIRIVEFTE